MNFAGLQHYYKMKCFVCGKSDGELTTITAKGKKTIIESSIQRQDGHHLVLNAASFLYCHNNCRAAYTNKIHIARFLAKNISANIDVNDFRKNIETVPNADCEFVDELSTVDIDDHATAESIEKCSDEVEDEKCVILGDVITLRQIKTKKAISRLHESTKEKLLSLCQDRTDEISLNMKARLLKVNDLENNVVRYHNNCYRSLRMGDGIVQDVVSIRSVQLSQQPLLLSTVEKELTVLERHQEHTSQVSLK